MGRESGGRAEGEELTVRGAIKSSARVGREGENGVGAKVSELGESGE